MVDFRGFCTESPSNDNAQPPSEPSVIVDRLEVRALLIKGMLIFQSIFQGMPIMTIGINRPEKRNSVDTETSEALKIAFQVVLYKFVNVYLLFN